MINSKDIEPSLLWQYFNEILSIPRLSKKEERIIAYLEAFASSHKLPCKKDDAGNILISKPASPGMENRETIVLQSHVDMVGEKLSDSGHDFTKDPIKAVINDGWITAEGTTLGADDGVGVAASLAILHSEDILHGPLECLFTTDEETGMTGAMGLKEGFLSGKILVNLDSEDEGEIYIGCAGGIDTVGKFQKKTRETPSNWVSLSIEIDGLRGGHSGDEIHKGYGNAIKILNRLLWNADKRFKFGIGSISGGKLRNGIPRDARALICCKAEYATLIKVIFEEIGQEIKKELLPVDPDLIIKIESARKTETIYKRRFQRRIMDMLYACPHGEIAWSKEIEGLVETSTNLAIIRDIDPEYLEVITSQRSSLKSSKKDIADRIAAIFRLARGEIQQSDGYPGWKPNPSSEILKVAGDVYRKLFNQEPEIKAIHAGLECGLILEKYPDLDMISIGPTIKGAHTPEERIDIASTVKFWDFLIEILKGVPLKT